MNSYNHKDIEPKWQKRWAEAGLYKTENSVPGKENFYTLVELPYPSGDLHVGHWSAFAVPDIFARMKRMQGYNVLYPIGFDSFGLPAENAAIKHGADPAEWTHANIKRMRAQLKLMGNMFDWEREVSACDPKFYKWTQWLFLQLFKKGLAYKKKALVNWDPVDQTVLANEQILPDGTAERSGANVEKKELAQWFLKITNYADRLIDDLDALDWPEPIKDAQRNWIGRSEGAEIDFPIKTRTSDVLVRVFTTRPDTLFGATYVVLAPEHELIQELAPELENTDEVNAYVEAALRKGELERQENKEKTGVELKGVKAINPATKEEIPIFVADYVLSGYGTGAIMAVPAHDERDFEFAKKYGLEVKQVIEPDRDLIPIFYSTDIKTKEQAIVEAIKDVQEGKRIYTFSGKLKNSNQFDELHSEEAKQKIAEFVGGRMTKTYRQRDWLISRQRYWGTPIPIVYDPEGNAHAVPDEHLPWLLPADVDFTPTGEAPLASSKELKERVEKLFGAGWTPEVDTMDTFVDSSWYFLRYLDPKNEKEFVSKELQKAWMPVDKYSGGAEHTTMHILYSRFFYKALYDLGLVTENEPYTVRMNRGLILAEDGRKMSKRWGNTINPDEQVKNVGADSVKMYLAFIGPYNEVGSFPWNTNGLIGMRRFLERVYKMGTGKFGDPAISYDPLSILLQQTIKKVTDDIESMKFNTAVSALMIFYNRMYAYSHVNKEIYETFLKLLAPFAPHMTEELWREKLGHSASIHLEPWPEYDAQKAVTDTVVFAVQIAGKMRGTVSVGYGAREEEVVREVKNDPRLSKYLDFKPKKVVFVPNKVINFLP